jgi:hypothetical protein
VIVEFTHEANPVRVNAQQIVKAIHCLSKDDPRIQTGWRFELEDGTELRLRINSPELARHIAVAGDYVVTQEDGYMYLNPKDVFERKYRRL